MIVFFPLAIQVGTNKFMHVGRGVKYLISFPCDTTLCLPSYEGDRSNSLAQFFFEFFKVKLLILDTAERVSFCLVQSCRSPEVGIPRSRNKIGTMLSTKTPL